MIFQFTAAELKTQISLLAMAGEVEGWLTAQPTWNLVADPVNATEWENLLRTALGETVKVTAPLPLAALAARPLPAQAATTHTAATNVARTISPFYGHEYRMPYASQLPHVWYFMR